MFQNCANFQVDIGSWQTGNVKSMKGMFAVCTFDYACPCLVTWHSAHRLLFQYYTGSDEVQWTDSELGCWQSRKHAGTENSAGMFPDVVLWTAAN